MSSQIACLACNETFLRDFGSGRLYCSDRCQKRAEKWRVRARLLGIDPQEYQRLRSYLYQRFLYGEYGKSPTAGKSHSYIKDIHALDDVGDAAPRVWEILRELRPVAVRLSQSP